MVRIRSWSFMVTITVVASRWTFVVTVLHRRAEKMYQTIKSTWPEVCFTNWQDTSFTREQNRNNKRMEIERFGWFIERIQTRVAFGWLSENSGEETSCPELSRNQSILRFDVTLQLDWAIEQCLLNVRVFFGGKTKSPCFPSFHPLADKINNGHLTKPFSRLYENRSFRSVHTEIGITGRLNSPMVLMSERKT